MSVGPSTTTAPYLVGSTTNVRFTSVVTVGDRLPDGSLFAGKPDGIGAFDNGNGTITVLINHELGRDLGVVRDHGSKGAYVDRLVIDKSTLAIVSSDDLIQSVRLWDDSTNSYVTQTTAFDRFCSSDLAAPSAFLAGALGTTARIYLTGEERDFDGRAFGTIVSGTNAGIAYELPFLGNMAFENVVANPFAQSKTVVALTDDVMGGQVYFYIGEKQGSGSEVERAGLTGGDFFGLKVSGIAREVDGSPANGTFTLQEIGIGGDVSSMSGAQIEAESDAEGVTGFLRPEDSAWDPNNPNVLYFTTTNSIAGNSRLYRATFNDITNPQLGGTITAVLDGSEGQRMLDNLTVANGTVILQEDPGNSDRLARVWQYDIATDKLTQLGNFDPAKFTPNIPGFITTDEESSGVIDVTAMLGDSDTRAYLLGAMVDAPTGNAATVTKGQLMVMQVDTGSGNPGFHSIARHDFDGDGRSDIFWQKWDGPVGSWLATPGGDFAVNPAFAYSGGISGAVAALGDFNGDRRADVLFVDGGAVTVALATAAGGFVVNNKPIGYAAPGWSVSSAGDFDGDGRVDLLWESEAHAIDVWLATATGGFAVNAANTNTQLPQSNVDILQTGDFNGDGRDDILWRNSSTHVVGRWLASPNGGFALDSGVAVGRASTSDWSDLGTGDFNGDGRDDIIWISSTKQVSIWLGGPDGKFTVDTASANARAATGWQFGAIGDYNGDGQDDVLWRHSSGALSQWLETPTDVFAVDSVTAFAAPDWLIVPS